VTLIETARKLARHRDAGIHNEAVGIALNSVNSFFINLRAYLQKQNDRLGTRNNIYGILKRGASQGGSVFSLGPQIDKFDTPGHFHFPSGARLSFGIALKNGEGCSLISYRFHYHLAEGSSPAFVRFDLNPESHIDPLSEPKCHVHPGRDDIRIPIPALAPLEVLDRIFFVLEPS
jgi:hypothetical protein